MKIRRVIVELLRAGRAHNQLLSPLTQYLGICGESAAGIVTLPYEHAPFLRRLSELRYETQVADESDLARRIDVLRETGDQIAAVLKKIPGFVGLFSREWDCSAVRADEEVKLIHLRLVMSASELAMIPFELSRIPEGSELAATNWMALQNQLPVCITRHDRSVATDNVRWPTYVRILFVAGNPSDIPFDDHCRALRDAVAPWLNPDQKEDDLLTILEDAGLDEIEAACHRACKDGRPYTHVHVLAHGAEFGHSQGPSYGLLLRDCRVVSGEFFASALSPLVHGRIRRPAVVTLASCDSGNTGSAIFQDSSLAHDLHRAGIPLVIASQFPLTQAVSVVMARMLYEEFLCGVNPLESLYRLRTIFYTADMASHDWASLVVYEALPSDVCDQFEEVQYSQGRQRLVAAQKHVEAIGRDGSSQPQEFTTEDRFHQVLEAQQGLPLTGRFAAECLGLIGSSYKILAEARFKLMLQAGGNTGATGNTLGPVDDQGAKAHGSFCRKMLQQAYTHYHRAYVRRRDPSAGQHEIAQLHWLLVQTLVLGTVLGKKMDRTLWDIAWYDAMLYTEHPDVGEQIWAYGSVAELWLLKLVNDETPHADQTANGETPDDLMQKATTAAGKLRQLAEENHPYAISSSLRQFRRYQDWWGHQSFVSMMSSAGVSVPDFGGAESGVAQTLETIIKKLEPAASKTADRQPAEETKSTTGAAAADSKPGLRATNPDARPKRQRRKSTKPPKPDSQAVFNIEMLPARNGDCLWIEYGHGKDLARFLIDCGSKSAYPVLKERIQNLPKEQRQFELYVLTHVDSDHISGTIPFFNDRDIDVAFGDVWFNGWKHLPKQFLGARQGEIFSTLLMDRELPWNQTFKGEAVVLSGDSLPVIELPHGMTLTLLSPSVEKLGKLAQAWEKELKEMNLTPGATDQYRRFLGGASSHSTDVDALAETPFKKDSSPANGSSIAFLAEYGGKSALFAADAHAPLVTDSVRKLLELRKLKQLPVNALKLSHHGSKNATSVDLLNVLDCRNYLVCSDGSYFHHPDRETIGRVIKYGGDRPVLWFNYESSDNIVWAGPELQQQYGYETVYPEHGAEGLRIEL